MGFYPELDGLTDEDLYAKFEGLDPDENESDYIRNETLFYDEVAYLIIGKEGKAGYRYLLSRIASVDTLYLEAILFRLSIAKGHEQEVRAILIRFLEDANDSILSRAIGGLTTIQDKSSYDWITGFLTHRSPYVRGSALRYLAKIDGTESIPSRLRC